MTQPVNPKTGLTADHAMNAPTTAAKNGPSPHTIMTGPGASIVNAPIDAASSVAKRVGAIAREARDVVTAVGTMAKKPGVQAATNVAKQIAEVPATARDGKRRSGSDTYQKNRPASDIRQISDPRKYPAPKDYQQGTVNVPAFKKSGKN